MRIPAQPPDDVLAHAHPAIFGHAFASISVRQDTARSTLLLINAEAMAQMGTPAEVGLLWSRARQFIVLDVRGDGGGVRRKVASNHGGGGVLLGKFNEKHKLTLAKGRLREFVCLAEGVFACGPVVLLGGRDGRGKGAEDA